MKKPEARSQKPAEVRCRARTFRHAVLIMATSFWLLASSPAPAQPTQEEVFKSIGENVNRPIDSSRLLAVLAGIAGAVVLIAVIGQWRGRERRPRPLNHHRRLMKEVLRNVPLRGAELKQIKQLAQTARPGARDEKVQSPLTLLLCPSLLLEATKQSRGKADLRVVGALARKMVGRSAD